MAIYTGIRRSSTLRQVQRVVYGDEYPDQVLPYGFSTRPAMRRYSKSGAAVGR